MGLLDKALKEIERQAEGDGVLSEETLAVSPEGVAALAAELASLEPTSCYAIEAWIRIAEALPLDPFVLLAKDGSAPLLLSSRCSPRQLACFPEGFRAFLDGAESGPKSSSSSLDAVFEAGYFTSPLLQVHPITDTGRVLRGLWVFGIPGQGRPDSEAAGLLHGLFSSLDARSQGLLPLAAFDADKAGTMLSSLGTDRELLGLRAGAVAIVAARDDASISRQGAAIAIGSALRAALGEEAQIASHPGGLCALADPDFPWDRELVKRQLGATLARALPGLPGLASIDFEIAAFGAQDENGEDPSAAGDDQGIDRVLKFARGQ